MMTPRERAEAALNLQIPDMVPTFELEFQLAEEMFGKPFLTQRDLEGKSASERDRLIKENAEYMLEVYEALEYSIIPLHYLNLEDWWEQLAYSPADETVHAHCHAMAPMPFPAAVK